MACNSKYDGYQRGLVSIVCRFFDKKSTGSSIKNKVKQNQQLVNKIPKSVIRKF